MTVASFLLKYCKFEVISRHLCVTQVTYPNTFPSCTFVSFQNEHEITTDKKQLLRTLLREGVRGNRDWGGGGRGEK